MIPRLGSCHARTRTCRPSTQIVPASFRQQQLESGTVKHSRDAKRAIETRLEVLPDGAGLDDLHDDGDDARILGVIAESAEVLAFGMDPRLSEDSSPGRKPPP